MRSGCIGGTTGFVSESAGDVVQAQLVAQVEALRDDVAAVRRGEPEAVHRARIDCRRLRAALATFRPLLDRAVTDPLRDELRWLAGSLSGPRDQRVVGELLLGMLAAEPLELVAGPVSSRMRHAYAGEIAVTLDWDRYGALHDALHRVAAEPPWTEKAEAPADKTIRARVRKELARVQERYDALAGADQPDEALHELRKAAKRLRYAAETWAPVGGKDAKRARKAARLLTSHLGERQDTVMTRRHLVALARAADAAGEPTFTYGRLHERETRRATDLDEGLPDVWRRFIEPATRSTC
jgi:CHAD domain-containing protein